MGWQQVCERLWGSDWIAPVSEVLHVNRRTVERWRSGANPMPPQLQEAIENLGRYSTVSRSYGAVLRRIANGETYEQIVEEMQDTRRALEHWLREKDRGEPLAVMAEGRPEE
ncbi:hypothetical protein [Aurantimonas sp. VKM B-3413]|uniref:hypothetical protein n=1 Tax=Aurantimonas sp. VKM B-3413 TaxID=2779401 RepID=UPI001E51A756|nr:hypothetical protein [Aurantimonas sp. VKM B-3413]MCB8840235.1 hypothetical protein [Aurantimonas sp. VKM B-3413]